MAGDAAGRGPEDTVLRAAALVDAGRPGDALAGLAAGDTADGESAAAERVRALAFLALDRAEDALLAARRAVTLDPDDATGVRVLSSVLLRVGDVPGALDAARRAVAADPDSWRAHHAVVEALWSDAAARPDALRASEEAVRLAPTEPYVHRRHADLLAASGRRRDAQAAYRRALRLAPEDRGGRHNLAVARLRHGHEGESALAFARLLASEPDNALARRNLMVSLVNPLARIRTVLGVMAVYGGVTLLDEVRDSTDRWLTATAPALGLVLALVVVVRFVAGTGRRLGWLIRLARRAVPGWTATAVTLGTALLVAVVGLFLPPAGDLAAQCLVLTGVVVASVQIRTVISSFPRP